MIKHILLSVLLVQSVSSFCMEPDQPASLPSLPTELQSHIIRCLFLNPKLHKTLVSELQTIESVKMVNKSWHKLSVDLENNTRFPDSEVPLHRIRAQLYKQTFNEANAAALSCALLVATPKSELKKNPTAIFNRDTSRDFTHTNLYDSRSLLRFFCSGKNLDQSEQENQFFQEYFERCLIVLKATAPEFLNFQAGCYVGFNHCLNNSVPFVRLITQAIDSHNVDFIRLCHDYSVPINFRNPTEDSTQKIWKGQEYAKEFLHRLDPASQEYRQASEIVSLLVDQSIVGDHGVATQAIDRNHNESLVTWLITSIKNLFGR